MTLEVDATYVDTDAIVTARGQIDLATVGILRDAIDAVSEKVHLVVVDLSEVTFLDSSGLRVMAQCHRQIIDAAGGSRLRLIVTSDPVARLLDISGLRTFFDIHATRDEARRDR